MLLLSLVNSNTKIERFLSNCVEAQDTTVASLTVNHLIMLRECWKLTLLNMNKKTGVISLSGKDIVPMKHIEEKYRVPKYIVSRNAIMLSEKGVEDKNLKSGRRQGKGWLKIVPLDKFRSDDEKQELTFDTRNKGIMLTKKGIKVCEILFSRLEGEL